MLYRILKIYARLAIHLYCRRIVVNKPDVLKSQGPLLLAANHPNSFLDGIILTTLFDQPVHSLARGDAFKNKWINQFLRRIQLLPVYRTSEGVENLEHNYTTFSACRRTFEKNGIVLIFSEGRCENEWHLRPLKKGTARLATSAWHKGIPVKVIPVGLNYSSFKSFGKEVHIFFGEPITWKDIDGEASQGKQLLQFNARLQKELQPSVYEIKEGDRRKLKAIFQARKKPGFYGLLLPATAGVLLHAPLFYPAKFLTELGFRRSGHYDSVLTALLLIAYPFYLLLLPVLLYFIHPAWALAALILLPFTAWAALQVKYQLAL